MFGGPQTDWFNDPATGTGSANAPIFGFAAAGDVQLVAKVSVDFASDFDAGVLFVFQSESSYAKLCFERSPEADPTVVSVVTRGRSDDANGPIFSGDSVFLRISTIGDAIAFHYSRDSDWWHLARYFSLGESTGALRLGFCAQSPTGSGCVATFSEITYVENSLTDPRDGS